LLAAFPPCVPVGEKTCAAILVVDLTVKGATKVGDVAVGSVPSKVYRIVLDEGDAIVIMAMTASSLKSPPTGVFVQAPPTYSRPQA
jgi:hypothetical protein